MLSSNESYTRNGIEREKWPMLNGTLELPATIRHVNGFSVVFIQTSMIRSLKMIYSGSSDFNFKRNENENETKRMIVELIMNFKLMTERFDAVEIGKLFCKSTFKHSEPRKLKTIYFFIHKSILCCLNALQFSRKTTGN